MAEDHTSLATIYKGWDVYQQHLVQAIAPLSLEQLALHAAPHLRSVGMIAAHIVSARVGWFHMVMGEGSTDLAPLAIWQRANEAVRSASELVNGLERSWQMMQDALARWSTADLEYIFQGTWQGQEYSFSRQWIIWHVIEHDLHHGGELSFSLGMHNIAAIDI
ncbi:MAG: DinB family protein [Chloroflexi bacterium]|nr:DinB family protein [Ktedonobacteraceae bacterium]MBV9020201.1 DinB family protein [Ktedonobacteraceae bacterium]MBV9706882.1 DinB family protein [Chloroflexota bacterium]